MAVYLCSTVGATVDALLAGLAESAPTAPVVIALEVDADTSA
jgi:hypothetical protein